MALTCCKCTDETSVDVCCMQLLLLSRKKERAKENLAIVNRLTPGTKVRAMYADEENEPAVSYVLR